MTKMIRCAVGAAGIAAAMLAGGAQALTVGDIQVKSGLGDNFKASIPVTLAAGEDISMACVKLDDTTSMKYKNVPPLRGYTMRVERNGNMATVNLSTTVGVSEPVIRVNLLIRCGAKVSTSREFLVTQTLQDADKK
jgi:pilus assembly protein FimV